ncbi:SHOCT domain-containing protein [soil metagenome]
MQQLTPQGQNLINDISRRYNLSYDSAVSMLVSVNNGGGSMAQFFCPELGGGQWMRGGMTMVGDLFNYSLKNTVNNLCGELSNLLANNQMFPPAPQGVYGGNNWYPSEFGSPSSSGAQNNIRYAFFPQARRLVVQRDGNITIFDTLDHQISGVSQQQGGNTSLSFSSQYGTVSTLSLPLLSGSGLQAAAPTNFADSQNFSAPAAPAPQLSPSPPQQPNGQNSADLMAILEKLGQLRDAGVLTVEEFQAKKTDLLNRL